MDKKKKLQELLKKRMEVEERLRAKMKRFRGVPHESASGELAYSEIKVLEDFIASLNAEIETLQRDLE